MWSSSSHTVASGIALLHGCWCKSNGLLSFHDTKTLAWFNKHLPRDITDKHPVLWGIKLLQMLLQSSSHVVCGSSEISGKQASPPPQLQRSFFISGASPEGELPCFLPSSYPENSLLYFFLSLSSLLISLFFEALPLLISSVLLLSAYFFLSTSLLHLLSSLPALSSFYSFCFFSN